ncbi:MAG: DUF6261 family protein [Bacteroidales bacterium]|jgi:hypothetical protein|nr:DUF6261 family protein [Bacteroidales bacterium]
MKIKKIKLSSLRNKEWFSFFTEFKSHVEDENAGTLNIGELFAVFLSLYADANTSMEKIRKSGITDAMVECDRRRDRAFRGFANAVLSAQTHYEEPMRAAALHLDILLDHYGNLAQKPINEETAGVAKFVQELHGEYAPDVATLNLQGWITELENANNHFAALVKERTNEAAGKTELKLMEVRKKTDSCYFSMVSRIEATMLLNGNDALGVFVKKINITIDRYNNLLNRRSGQGKQEETED